jgi:hypothetical protein
MVISQSTFPLNQRKGFSNYRARFSLASAAVMPKWALKSDRHCGLVGVFTVIEHQVTCMVQAHFLEILHRRFAGGVAKSTIKDRGAHTDTLSESVDAIFASETGTQLLQDVSDAGCGITLIGQHLQYTAMAIIQRAIKQLPHQTCPSSEQKHKIFFENSTTIAQARLVLSH